MELQILKSKSTRGGRPTISFSKVGVIALSAVSAIQIGIKDGQSVSIAYDKAKDKDWYLVVHKGNVEEWPQVRNMKKSEGTPSFAFNCSAFSKEFLSKFKVDETSAKVPLSTEGQSVLNGEAVAYAIITKALEK